MRSKKIFFIVKKIKGRATILMLAFSSGYRQVALTYNKHSIVHAQKRELPVCLFSHVRILAVFDEKRTRAKSSDFFIFGQDIFEREINCYLQRANAYGVPLDNRKAYTKSDWLCWVATLTNDEKKREKLLSGIAKFLKDSPDRVPFSDWYDTDSGSHFYFRARSVQGGCFILLLGNPDR